MRQSIDQLSRLIVTPEQHSDIVQRNSALDALILEAVGKLAVPELPRGKQLEDVAEAEVLPD